MSDSFKIIFDKDGNHYPDGVVHAKYRPDWLKDCKEMDNHVLNATLKYVYMEQATSTVRVTWEDVNTGIQYCSRGELLHKALKYGGDKTQIINGVLHFKSYFTFINRSGYTFLTENENI